MCARRFVGVIAGLALVAAVLSASGCSAGSGAKKPAGEEKKGYGMGGVEQQIAILADAVNNKPAPWVLDTPEATVRSYLDWVSYAYRVAESDVASATQSPYQVVRTDAYIQANLQDERLLDQVLTSITFGSPSIEGTRAMLPAKEQWSYRYVSIKEAGKTIGGPYTASYETTYTLAKGDNGWVVDGIEVKALGEVK